MTKALAFGQNYSSEGGHRPVRSPGTRGRGTGDGGGVVSETDANYNFRPSASYLVTPSSVWNFEI